LKLVSVEIQSAYARYAARQEERDLRTVALPPSEGAISSTNAPIEVNDKTAAEIRVTTSAAVMIRGAPLLIVTPCGDGGGLELLLFLLVDMV
jgi:hypothetical protein